MHHIWWYTKGPAITWGQYRLCQTGKGCLEPWLWVSGTLVESIFQGRQPPHGLTTVELSGQPSLSLSISVLLRRVSPLGNWGKTPSPLQLMAGNLRKLRLQVGGYTTLPMLRGWDPTSVYQAFLFFLSLNSNSLFHDLTHLRGGPKRKVCLQATKVVLVGALPGVTQRQEMQLPDPPWGSKGN
jgi:hypothetical protein